MYIKLRLYGIKLLRIEFLMVLATKIGMVQTSKGQNLPFLDRRDSDQIARMQETVLLMPVTIDRIEPSSITVARWN